MCGQILKLPQPLSSKVFKLQAHLRPQLTKGQGLGPSWAPEEHSQRHTRAWVFAHDQGVGASNTASHFPTPLLAPGEARSPRLTSAHLSVTWHSDGKKQGGQAPPEGSNQFFFFLKI